MQARLSAVQNRLWLVLAATLVVLVVTLPRPENRRLVGALEEMESFRHAFDRAAAERALREQAESASAASMQDVEKAAQNRHAYKLKLAPSAPPVRPISVLDLGSLAAVEQHAQPGTTVTVGAPDVNALGASIGWRLARTSGGPFTLLSAELLLADVDEKDVALEQEVARLRAASIETRKAVEEATRRVEIYEQRVEFQTKARSKYLGKSREALYEARTALDEKTRLMTDTQASYDAEATRAQEPRKLREPNGTVPTAALARVVVSNNGTPITFDIPVPLRHRRVPVTPLTGANFAHSKEASLWDEVKGLDADGAVRAIRSHFNWHMAALELGPVTLKGAYLLQLLPAIMPVLLYVLLVHIRRAATSYSPFSTKVPEQAPRVGFGSRIVEAFVLVVLPLGTAASAATALILINHVPVIPALAAVACFGLGGYAFTELKELREQTVWIVRSHSYLPPEPQNPTAR